MKQYLGISGDYQYRALHQGIFVQRTWHRNKIRLVDERFKITSDDVVLEIGCGSGNLLAKMAKSASRVTGVDISEACIDFAQQQCAGLKNVDFLVSAIRDLALPDSYYSKVVCQEVIEHLVKEEIDQLMSKSYQALKPGGQFLITTPNYRSLWPVIEYLMDKLNLSPLMEGHQHVTKLSMRQLKEWLASFRFQIVGTGGFNTVAPWVGFLPENLVNRLNRFEIDHISILGNLIYAIARKPF